MTDFAGLDASKINEIIQNASEGSKYYLHKRKAQEKLDAKISEMLATAKSFSPHQLEAAAEQVVPLAMWMFKLCHLKSMYTM